MAKKPAKPEGRESKPRFKAEKPLSLSAAVEAARSLFDRDIKDIEPDRLQNDFIIDDRSFAIVRAANLENALELAILGFLTVHKGEKRNLFKTEGPLGTFSKKITMGYALDAFGPTTKDNLDILRHIRNTFAHSKVPINFETIEISQLSGLLKFPPTIETQSSTINYPNGTDEFAKWGLSRKRFFQSSFVSELSLLKLALRKREETILRLGGSPSPMPDFRIKFDDSMP